MLHCYVIFMLMCVYVDFVGSPDFDHPSSKFFSLQSVTTNNSMLFQFPAHFVDLWFIVLVLLSTSMLLTNLNSSLVQLGG